MFHATKYKNSPSQTIWEKNQTKPQEPSKPNPLPTQNSVLQESTSAQQAVESENTMATNIHRLQMYFNNLEKEFKKPKTETPEVKLKKTVKEKLLRNPAYNSPRHVDLTHAQNITEALHSLIESSHNNKPLLTTVQITSLHDLNKILTELEKAQQIKDVPHIKTNTIFTYNYTENGTQKTALAIVQEPHNPLKPKGTFDEQKKMCHSIVTQLHTLEQQGILPQLGVRNFVQDEAGDPQVNFSNPFMLHPQTLTQNYPLEIALELLRAYDYTNFNLLCIFAETIKNSLTPQDGFYVLHRNIFVELELAKYEHIPTIKNLLDKINIPIQQIEDILETLSSAKN